jgi:hypothetical protein
VVFRWDLNSCHPDQEEGTFQRASLSFVTAQSWHCWLAGLYTYNYILIATVIAPSFCKVFLKSFFCSFVGVFFRLTQPLLKKSTWCNSTYLNQNKIGLRLIDGVTSRSSNFDTHLTRAQSVELEVRIFRHFVN